MGPFPPPGKVQTYPGRVLTEASSGSAAASSPAARHTPPCRGPSLQDRDTHTPSHVCTIAGAAAAADAEIPEVPPCCWQVMQAALAGAASSSSSASFLVGFSRSLRSHALIPPPTPPSRCDRLSQTARAQKYAHPAPGERAKHPSRRCQICPEKPGKETYPKSAPVLTS